MAVEAKAHELLRRCVVNSHYLLYSQISSKVGDKEW